MLALTERSSLEMIDEVMTKPFQVVLRSKISLIVRISEGPPVEAFTKMQFISHL